MGAAKESDTLEELLRKKAFISDMDGVIYHGNLLLPGVREFVDWLEKNGKEYAPAVQPMSLARRGWWARFTTRAFP